MPRRSAPEHPTGTSDPVGYPSDLARDVEEEGFRYHVRPIRPDDAERLVAFHHHLSAQSIYLRFFSFHPELSALEVARFTTVDYVDRLALVAVHGDQLIAVGRFDRDPDEAEAEVAFVVADEYQHHGIGTLLLDDLARAARQRGIDTFRADTLAENRTMLEVFHHAGFPVTSSSEYGTVRLRFPISLSERYAQELEVREARRRPPAVSR